MNVAQFISGLLLIVLSAGLYFASRSRKAHAGQLNQAQTLDLHQAAQGRFYGKVQGSIVADQALTTPYSARPAVAWSAHLERGTEKRDEDGTTTKWQTVWSQSATWSWCRPRPVSRSLSPGARSRRPPGEPNTAS